MSFRDWILNGRRQVHILIAWAAALTLALLAGCATLPAKGLGPVRNPNTADFNPGLIISDDSFYNSEAMTAQQIQAFLEKTECKPQDSSPCLADYRQTTIAQKAAGRGHCTKIPGEKDQTAARIIANISNACGVSPRTLLVLLQKEQSLITKPSAGGYQKATGYGCPDTAPCDQEYFGFFNQVYRAAWQFRQYTENPSRRYHIGTVTIGYNPNEKCGGRAVEIQNQATANLYNYTPYQPNTAALAGANKADTCSSFGNLNFWRIWKQWFGEPTTVRFTAAYLPSCTRLVGGHPCSPPKIEPPEALHK